MKQKWSLRPRFAARRWQLERFANFGNPKLCTVLENHCYVSFSLMEI